MSQLEGVFVRLREQLEVKHQAREEALQLSRRIIQYAANAIRATHRGESGTAHEQRSAAQALVQQVRAVLSAHPDLYHAGYVQDALKEYVEAYATEALVTGEPLPSPEVLGVALPAYLNGLGEAASELRRHILDALRRDELARCEALLERMEDLYTELTSLDYPEAITGGLKRTTDMLRGVLERTRGDWTVAQRQHQLETRLVHLKETLARIPLGSDPESAAP